MTRLYIVSCQTAFLYSAKNCVLLITNILTEEKESDPTKKKKTPVRKQEIQGFAIMFENRSIF